MVASRRASVQSVGKKSLSAILDFAIWGRSKTMKSVTSHGAKIVGKNVTVNGCLIKARQMTKDEGCIPAATSETKQDFIHSRSQNLFDFLALKSVFPPSVNTHFRASRAIRYNTLHLASKVVCQRDALWKPHIS